MAGRRTRLDTNIFPGNYVDPPLRREVPSWHAPDDNSYAADGDWLMWGRRHAKGARASYQVAGEYSRYALQPNVQGIRRYQERDTTSLAFTSDRRHDWVSPSYVHANTIVPLTQSSNRLNL